jgi:hypothetical protein
MALVFEMSDVSSYLAYALRVAEIKHGENTGISTCNSSKTILVTLQTSRHFRRRDTIFIYSALLR